MSLFGRAIYASSEGPTYAASRPIDTPSAATDAQISRFGIASNIPPLDIDVNITNVTIHVGGGYSSDAPKLLLHNLLRGDDELADWVQPRS